MTSSVLLPKTPEVQHIADEVHPPTMEEHAREQCRIGGNGYGCFGEICLPEQKGRDCPVLEYEGLVQAKRKAGLVEKDEDAGHDRCDRDHRR